MTQQKIRTWTGSRVAQKIVWGVETEEEKELTVVGFADICSKSADIELYFPKSLVEKIEVGDKVTITVTVEPKGASNEA